jgi:hypothetical protein
MRILAIALGLLIAATAAFAGAPSELSPPVRLLAQGKPIDVDHGHAAPFVANLDGDGVKHLLVGQFRDGKLRIYHGAGAGIATRFVGFTWFLDGAPEGRVPAS